MGIGPDIKTLRWIGGVIGSLLVILVIVTGIFIYAGFFDVAADKPHSDAVYRLLQTIRLRSIATRASDAVPTDLADPKRIAAGAAQYAEMCSGCHLGPGVKRTEISRGLYPRAPELKRGSRLTSAEEFWVLKHGIKMSGMPAWGVTHNDELLWDIVAFLQTLPNLTTDQYQAVVNSSPKTHDEMMREMELHDGGRDAPR